ncbi:MAG: efflux RND transporter periplasmic adaptor subunit [Pseudomonadota bacterium]
MKLETGLAAVLSLLLVSCSSGESTEPTEPLVRPAKLVVAEKAGSRRDLSFPASVEAEQSAELTFQIAGEIRELNVLEGDAIETGTLIAKLDQRDAQNDLAQAEAEYQNAEAEYQRARRLAEQDAISRSVLESRESDRDVKLALLRTARKALSDTVLLAPFDGVISRVDGRQFQNVQAKEVVVVIQSLEVEAVINVPSTILARSSQLEPENVSVILDVAPGQPIPAVFKESTLTADAATQTYEVAFTFTPPEDITILPGMTGTVQTSFNVISLIDSEAESELGVAVPLTAILAEGDAQYVWVVDPDTMALSKRRVETRIDASTVSSVSAISGLEGGETVVAAGVAFFHEGMIVRPWVPE